MAGGDNKVLHQLIQKLGLANHESLAPKSTELQRLLDIRSSSGMTTNLGDYAKATLCIDIAAGLLGLPFDSETALKLSGLRKTAYNNGRRTLEKILDINKTIGINEICVQLGLNQVQKEATGLLDAYKRYAGASSDIDFTHPQYATMAVFQACRRQKVRVAKLKLVPFSHLKATQWNLLEKNWEKFLDSVDHKSKSGVKEQKGAQEPNSNGPEARSRSGEAGTSSGRKHASPEKIEPYHNWKKRMLEKAYRELELLRGSG
uniref:Uncharacterized protein n=1 Tax=Anopheles atroparvus TaxID=41427 RepID=A0A182IK57_ANOAO